jgi:hypothetical protein
VRKLYAPFLIVHVGVGALLLLTPAPLWMLYLVVAALFGAGMGLRAWLGRTWTFARLRQQSDDPHGALRAYEQFSQEYQRRRTLWTVAEVLTAQRYYLDAGSLVNQAIAMLDIEDPELEPEVKARLRQAHTRAPHLVEPAAYLAAIAALDGEYDEALTWVDEGMRRDPPTLRALLQGDPQLKAWLSRSDVRARLGIEP